MSEKTGDSLKNPSTLWNVECRPETDVREEPVEVYCFRIPMSRYPLAAERLVDMKSTGDGQSNMMVALMMSFFEMIRRTNEDMMTFEPYIEHLSKTAEQGGAAKPWAKLYVEMVPKDEPEEDIRKRKEDFEKVLRAKPNLDRSAIFWEPLTPLAEIRFWLLKYDCFYQLPFALTRMMETVKKERESYSTRKRPIVRGANSNSVALPSDVGPAAGVAWNAFQGEHWKMFADVGEYTKAISLYMQRNESADDAAWVSKSIYDPEHVANPLTAFNPIYPFAFVDTENVPRKEFIKLSNYMSFESSGVATLCVFDPVTKKPASVLRDMHKIKFTFPNKDCVIGPIPLSEVSPHIMEKRLTPETQFNNYWESYAVAYTRARPVGEFSIVNVPAELAGRAANAEDVPANEDPNSDNLEGVEPDNSDPLAEGPLRLMSRVGTECSDSLKYWAAKVKMAGGGATAFAPMTKPMHTNRLATMDVRTREEILDQSTAGASRDKIAALKLSCTTQYDEFMRNADLLAARVIEKKLKNIALDQGEEQEYVNFPDSASIRRAARRRACRMAQDQGIAKIASLLSETSELQASDAVFAKFGSHMIGEVLSDRCNLNLPIYDDGLSVFANFAAFLMQQLEDVELFSNAHSHALIAWFGRNSCLRRELGMVFNMLIVGGPGTAKSYLLILLERWGIPGSSVVRNTISPKSLFTDDNKNCQVRIIHELTAELMDARSAKNNTELVGQLKDMMTRSMVGYDCFQSLANGGRSSRQVNTEHNSCHFYAGNITAQYMDRALKTRFHYVGTFTPKNRYRSNKTIEAMAVSNGTEPAGLTDERLRFHDYSRVIQQLVWLVEIAIMCKVLPEPTIFCTIALMQKMLPALKKEVHCAETLVRTQERIKILARCIVVVNAINYLFFVPGAPYLNEPFVVKHLLDAERYLVDTEEIALFTITLLSEAIENADRANVLKAVAIDIQERMKKPDELPNIFSRPHKQRGLVGTTSRSGRFGQDRGAPQSNGNSGGGTAAAAPSMNVEATASPTELQAALAAAKAFVRDIKEEEISEIMHSTYDYSYLRIGMKPTAYARVLHSIMDKRDDVFSRMISEEQISEVLVQLSRTTNALPSYTLPMGTSTVAVLCGKTPPQFHSEKTTKYEMQIDDAGMTLHYEIFKEARSWIEQDKSTFMERELPNTRNKHTRARRIIIGVSMPFAPFAFKAEEMGPDPSKEVEVEDPFHRTQQSKALMSRSYKRRIAKDDDDSSNGTVQKETKSILPHSIEDEAMYRHLVKMYLPPPSRQRLTECALYTHDAEIIQELRAELRQQMAPLAASPADVEKLVNAEFHQYPMEYLADITQRIAVENEAYALEKEAHQAGAVPTPVSVPAESPDEEMADDIDDEPVPLAASTDTTRQRYEEAVDDEYSCMFRKRRRVCVQSDVLL